MRILEWKMSVMIALVASLLSAQAGGAQVTAASLAAGTGIYAELNSGVDSKKAKVGDVVTLSTTAAVKSSDDRTILPKGTKVIGRVTQSEARSKGANESTLGLAFDKAVLKDGQEVALHVIVQAIGAPVSHSVDPSPAAPDKGVAQGVVRTSPMGAEPRNAPTAGMSSGETVPDVNSQAQLGPRSHGVVGMPGLALSQAAVNAALDAVVTSSGKNVHLESGTRFLLVERKEEMPAQ